MTSRRSPAGRADRPRPVAGEGLSDAKLAARTGRSARQWFEILDAEAATRLSHDRIVALLVEEYEAPEWGAQSIAVRYQRDRGIPLPGEQPDGSFEVKASRSIRGVQSALLELAIRRGSEFAHAEPTSVHRLPERSTASWTLAHGELCELRVIAAAAGRCTVNLVLSGVRLPERVSELRRSLELTVATIVRDSQA